MTRKGNSFLRFLDENLIQVIAIVLVWRGIWYLLDKVDYLVFGGSHTITAIIGLLFGFFLIYKKGVELV